MDATTKTRESILREIAAKQGFDLIESDGTYRLAYHVTPGEKWRGQELDNRSGSGLSLNEIEAKLRILG